MISVLAIARHLRLAPRRPQPVVRVEVACPNCRERVAVPESQEKASCPRCGNVWGWRGVRRVET